MKDQRWYDDNKKTRHDDASIRDPWADVARGTYYLLLRINQLEQENADLRQALNHARDVRIPGLKNQIAELELELNISKAKGYMKNENCDA